MKLTRNMRLGLALSVILTLLGIAAAAVGLAGSLAQVWESLKTGPTTIFYGLILFLLVTSALGGWLIWRLLFPGDKKPVVKPTVVVTETDLRTRIENGRERGLDVSAAERELAELARRRDVGRLYVCVFGEISTGKSTLIRALVPDAEVAIGVVGGTTREIEHYRWTTPHGDVVLVADVPGSAAPGSEDEAAALAEAVRAHIVIYVCDSDLGREQFEELRALTAIEKPLVLALNKSDRYAVTQIEQLEKRLRQRLAEAGASSDTELVAVSCRTPDRSESTGSGRAARQDTDAIEPLRQALQRLVDRSPDALNALRDGAVFAMVSSQLDALEQARRRQRADAVVRDYTRKAVVGAVAAVGPGTDILIQGVLGTAMVRELCAIYEVPAKEVEISRLLDLSQGYVGRTLPILLAVAGNALKAFPGVGTIAGGVTHAVAYGLIFDALGKGLTGTLAEGGELRVALAARKFRENLGEDLRARTIGMARMAIEARRDDD